MTEDTDIPRGRWFPLCWGSATDVGRVREHNEDAVCGDPQMGVFLVADGMGGHHGGAMASKIVTTVLPSMIKTRLDKLGVARNRAYRYWLRRDILKLSQQLRAESKGQVGFHGMGATLVLALVLDKGTHIAHLGDSRAYLYRGGQLTQQTDDHSIVGILLRQGEITAEEAKDHPARGSSRVMPEWRTKCIPTCAPLLSRRETASCSAQMG